MKILEKLKEYDQKVYSLGKIKQIFKKVKTNNNSKIYSRKLSPIKIDNPKYLNEKKPILNIKTKTLLKKVYKIDEDTEKQKMDLLREEAPKLEEYQNKLVKFMNTQVNKDLMKKFMEELQNIRIMSNRGKNLISQQKFESSLLNSLLNNKYEDSPKSKTKKDKFILNDTQVKTKKDEIFKKIMKYPNLRKISNIIPNELLIKLSNI